MANDALHHPTASRGFFLLTTWNMHGRRHPIRVFPPLLACAVLLQLGACGTTPAPPQRANWEPGCTGPASFCVPFFGP
ncbi:hypothetical protein [Paraburkholderia solisilvae]|uniref:Uncharacterized protein n=1 Tax=Paraburkholderia solisilvae TaxID=624376 RepID=A0A6J5DIE8_9BURK|nr:hypothetical protein [Paraburkholderia solisilvae]CAB3753969.1 hypothetical protein LMG29739_01846 [Paraburkholderia solisilvae]